MGPLPKSLSEGGEDTVLDESTFPDGKKYFPLGSVTVRPALPIQVEACRNLADRERSK